MFTIGDIGPVAYPGLLEDEDILAAGAGYDPKRSTLVLDATLGCLIDAGAPEGEASEMPFPMDMALIRDAEGIGDPEDSEDNEECAGVTLFDVLSDVLFDVSFDVLFDVLLVVLAIVLLVVSTASTLCA